MPILSIDLDSELYEDFVSEAEAAKKPPADLLYELIYDYLARQHDAWFRAQVQEALDDPSPTIPHEQVMRETKELIERIAARKARA